ncbi:hypothetical protein D3C76_1482670 [compost metagenome]
MQLGVALKVGKDCFKQTVCLSFGILASGLAGGDQRLADLVRVEGHQAAVALVQPVMPYPDQRAVHLPSRHYI